LGIAYWTGAVFQPGFFLTQSSYSSLLDFTVCVCVKDCGGLQYFFACFIDKLDSSHVEIQKKIKAWTFKKQLGLMLGLAWIPAWAVMNNRNAHTRVFARANVRTPMRATILGTLCMAILYTLARVYSCLQNGDVLLIISCPTNWHDKNKMVLINKWKEVSIFSAVTC